MSGVKQTPPYLAATLAGRCANGNERDQGTRVHAVPYSDTLARNGYCTTKAACGAEPGRRSAGWSTRTDLAPNCPRCLPRIAKATAIEAPFPVIEHEWRADALIGSVA